MIELKPCPFCGSEATIWMFPKDKSGEYSFSVECDNEKCGCIYGDNMELTRDEVVERWNRRASHG